jgi:8-oxo-dGTP pyrophosphatase MutT (NUDIX family)
VHSAAMRADFMEGGESGLIASGLPSRTSRPSAKFFRLSQLRKLRGCGQVAAVCYRVRPGGIEFLLVRTNSGHWTFPKGKAEPGLTHAQAAALEAFEEAGVHGRMEEASFAWYVRRKRGDLRDSARSTRKPGEEELSVQAHLCQVSRLEPPQESNRHPTWFSTEKAKRRLQEDRSPDFAAELARVVDRAVTRIRRLRNLQEAAH